MTVTAEQKRAAAVTHCGFVVAHGTASISYVYGGGLDLLTESMVGMERLFADGRKWEADCRAAVDWVIKWSGWAPFRVGGFDASSGEAWESLPHFYNVEDCGPGTLVAYGSGGDAHIGMITAVDGNNPWMMSHGYAYSDNHKRYQDETAYHAALGQSVTLLSVAPLLV